MTASLFRKIPKKKIDTSCVTSISTMLISPMSSQQPHSFQWDPNSFSRKLFSDIQVTVSTPTPLVSVGKSFPLTPPHDPTRDAYRNCSECGKHYNYHTSSQNMF